LKERGNMQNITTEAAEVKAEPLHPLLQEKVERYKQRIEAVHRMSPAIEHVLALEAAFPDFYMNRDLDIFDADAVVRFRFKTLAQAAEVLRFLAARGLHLNYKPVHHENDKSINWSLPGIYMVGYFRSEEEGACRYVQVGTKEVPVYELRCGGQPAEAPQEPAAAPVAAELEGVPF
jgi:hypothetical protein